MNRIKWSSPRLHMLASWLCLPPGCLRLFAEQSFLAHNPTCTTRPLSYPERVHHLAQLSLPVPKTYFSSLVLRRTTTSAGLPGSPSRLLPSAAGTHHTTD